MMVNDELKAGGALSEFDYHSQSKYKLVSNATTSKIIVIIANKKHPQN